MRAGRLNHRVSVQQLAPASPQMTAEGEPDESWEDLITDQPASIDPIVGREYFAAEQIQSEVDTKIGMRYEPGRTSAVTAKMRIVHGDTIYSIQAVVNIGARNRELVCYCKTGVNNG